MGKQEFDRINGTPEKRLFLSIISDYDLQTGLCELVDNAIDFWEAGGRKGDLVVSIDLDADRQIIVICDNAGGVKENDLRLLVAPGASGNSDGQQLIGVFGVGGKRAGVALGDLVEIRTRHKKGKSVQIDINKEWLATDEWDIPAYDISPIEPATTSVTISQLRQRFDSSDIQEFRSHLSETYSKFIRRGCTIVLNGTKVKPSVFDKWAYPVGFEPKTTTFQISAVPNAAPITVQITAGLILDRDPERENYGVYFYCNDRLIIKELKTRDVGYFVTSEAGVPHPDASLCRVIVEMQGPASHMPWNSSKSGLNFHHPVFVQLRAKLIEFVAYFTSLSRRLKNNWEEDVFAYQTGAMSTIGPEEIFSNRRLILPQLPRVKRLARIEQIKVKNARIIRAKPWTLGLVESLGLVDVIVRQKFETKNRAALILLDSNFEIALKEFIVNRTDLFAPQQYTDLKIIEIFKARHKVINEVRAHVNFSQGLLDKVNHFYNLRNKLVHERATVGITDSQVEDYQATVEQVLTLLFGFKFPN